MSPQPTPLRPEDYGKQLPRISSRATSPLEPDWLLARSLHRDVSRALRSYARGRLLDIGCGGRPYEAAELETTQYIGIDTPASPLSRPDVWGLAGRLPFADGVFDTVLCTQVLEHVAEPWVVLREVARVLKVGGYVILTAPQAANLHEIPYDFFRYTRFGLEALCQGHDLQPIETVSEGGFFASVGFFTVIHIGSYAQWGAQFVQRGLKSKSAKSNPEGWRRWFWLLRLPMATANLIFAALDLIPQPGLFALNNLVVAQKTK